MLCGGAASPTVRILAISYAVLIPQISYSRVGPASAPAVRTADSQLRRVQALGCFQRHSGRWAKMH